MLTIFSLPKAFTGHIGTIQRNAIVSWTLLRPRPEIILLGNEAGTAELARVLGLQHIPDVACNEHGTPLLSDLVQRAESNATTNSRLMCYVNADILLLSDFAQAVQQVQSRLGKFLIVSQRINLEMAQPINFDTVWERGVKKAARERGTPGDHTAIDVFVFPKGMYPQVPRFGVGRLWFDQWLIKAAREQHIPVVDVSRTAPVLHQNHDYNHVSGGEERVWRGVEAEHNLELYGGKKHAYTLLSATHELRKDGTVRRVWLRKPVHQGKRIAWELLIRRTVDLRNALRLRRKFWHTRKSAANSR